MPRLGFRLILGLLGLALAGPTHADEHAPASLRSEPEVFTYLDKVFPVSNLEKQFRTDVPQQGLTSACGSFAAIGVLEAACKRATHKSLDLSEAFVAYRRLRKNLQAHDSFGPWELREDGRLVAAYEAENPGTILKDVQKNRAICLEKDLGFDRDFFPLVQELKAELQSKYFPPPEKPPEVVTPPAPLAGLPPAPVPPPITLPLSPTPLLGVPALPPFPVNPPPPGPSLLGNQGSPPISFTPFEPSYVPPSANPHSAAIKADICTGLDDSVGCRVPEKSRDETGILPAEIAPEIKDCLDNLADVRVIKEATHFQALSLLAAGQPISCMNKAYNGGYHAFVIQGARASEKKPGQVEWLLRDSALPLYDDKLMRLPGKAKWKSWEDISFLCHELTVLPTKGEAESVDKILAETTSGKAAELEQKKKSRIGPAGTPSWPQPLGQ